MGANAISRPRTQRDPLRMFRQVKGSPFDSVRRWQTSQSWRNFPDTEEVTGSNPVRPTPFFEILSSARNPNGSQAPAVLPNKCWSRHWYLGLCPRRTRWFWSAQALSRRCRRGRQPPGIMDVTHCQCRILLDAAPGVAPPRGHREPPAGRETVAGQRRSTSITVWAKACGASCGTL